MKKKTAKIPPAAIRRAARKPSRSAKHPPVATALPARELRERGEPYLPGGESWEEILWLDKVA